MKWGVEFKESKKINKERKSGKNIPFNLGRNEKKW